ncbi:hypothetical protein AB0N81_36720 [Streptomyces sp. NPDC093510]|uniref:hypothetical protein n=1 Tax=Streptomyces sp. NPDC093510 TaxID=3155199 RepID=UPI003426BC3B
MTSSERRPLLFLDVDGPLIPFGATARELPDGYPTYPAERAGAAARETSANPLLARAERRDAAHHPGRALLRRVDARYGLGNADFHALEEWLRAR